MTFRIGPALVLMSGLGLSAAAQTQPAQPLAEVNGEAITAQQVEKALAQQLSKLAEQTYNLKLQKVDELIGEKLLAREAAKRGISVEALLEAEVTAKANPVTPQELEALYEANKTRVKGEETAVREQLRTYLRNQKIAAQRGAFLRSLRSQAKVVVHLEAPPVLRAEIPVDGAPFRGPAMAPVTIVKFEDFQCPFCRKAQATLAEIVSKYPEKVKFVHRDFPLDSLHPASWKAHEAARCAGEQGKFWEYHDKLFSSAPNHGPEQLKAYAQQTGLDVAAFERCVTTAKYQTAVQRDIDEGTRFGVNATPAFFINGRLLSGAQPLENFVRVIQEELARPTPPSK